MTKNIITTTNFTAGSSLRISTEEIDQAVKQLETAFIDGRLDDAELEERMTNALKAKTEDDLAQLLRDLERAEQTRARGPKTLRRLKAESVAIFSGMEQKGSFILPKKYRVSAIFGGCLIDLSKAHLESPESTIHVEAIFGGVQIIVPRGVRIEVDGMPILGGISKNVDTDDLPDDAPVIYIHAKAICGGVEILMKR